MLPRGMEQQTETGIFEWVDGKPCLRLHPGQKEAWNATERFVAVLAGTQGGKTAFGPWYLYREIKRRGSGDYLAVTSSYPLFRNKMLPALLDCFEHTLGIGRYWSSDRIIELKDPKRNRFLASKATDRMYARIMLGSARSESTLEAATAKAAWLDEAGQKEFTISTWRSIRRRLARYIGPALLTTTLYNFGWLKTEVYDRARRGDPDYRVVHFRSIDNPTYPLSEWEEHKRDLPPWLFAMQHEGRYERPAGLIYDSFIDDYLPLGHKCPRFAIPLSWPHFLGLDFGGVNTAGVFLAREPGSGTLYAHRLYLAGGRTATEHRRQLVPDGGPFPVAVGGSPSEGQWRDEFKAAGLEVLPPDQGNVEVGIARVYGAFKRREIVIFDDHEMQPLIDQLKSYSRKLDASGQPTEAIENKETYHYLDAIRYVIGWLNRVEEEHTIGFIDNPMAGIAYGRS